MTHEFTSTVRWTDGADSHGEINMDNGFEDIFHKPAEFGGTDGVLNPENAFIGSLAMCYSITFKSIAEKMRLDVNDFTLVTEGVMEEKDGGSEITEIVLTPSFTLKNGDKEKGEKAAKLAKENCVISRSMRSEVILEEIEINIE